MFFLFAHFQIALFNFLPFFWHPDPQVPVAEQLVEVGECSGKEAAAALFEAKVNSRNFLTREQHKLSCLTDPLFGWT